MNKILTIFAVIVVVCGGLLYWQFGNSFSVGTDPVMCAMDAKLCPDGSAVGRSGPKCEFAKCPVSTGNNPGGFKSGEVTIGVGQSKAIDNLTIKVDKITQDSRCPSDVQCIQAGTVTVQVTFVSDSTEFAELSLNAKSHVYGDHLITLTGVLPEKISTQAVKDSDYQLTFFVEKVLATSTDGGSGSVSGVVTLSPICPVERNPPDPSCAPKPYQTKIQVFVSDGTELIQTVESGVNGAFQVNLPGGNYVLVAVGGNTYPRCESKSVTVIKGKNSLVEISCDTGIR